MKYRVILNWPKVATKGELLSIESENTINGKTYLFVSNGNGWRDWVDAEEFYYYTESN